MSEVLERNPAAHAAQGDLAGWLARQCRLVGARAGMAAWVEDGVAQAAVAWPDSRAAEGLGSLLGRVAGGEGSLAARLPGPATPPRWAMAYPLLVEGRVAAAVALVLPAEDGADRAEKQRQLEWGLAGLELLQRHRREAGERQRLEALAAGFDILAATLAQARSRPAALAFVTALCMRLGAERVSHGEARRGEVRLTAMSHTAAPERKMGVVRLVEAAMQEAADQRRMIAWPPQPGDGAAAPIARAAERLAAQEVPVHVVALPIFHEDAVIAALVLEFPGASPPSAASLDRIASLAALVALVLREKAYRDRWIGTKVLMSLRDIVVRLVGPRYAALKLGVLAGAAAMLFLALAEGAYRLPAAATLVSRSQQTLAAPFQGYLRAAAARAGDRVERDQVLAELEDHDLQLERLRLLGELARVEGQQQRAVAERDRSRTAILLAEREQFQAQLGLVTQQIQRARVAAPFAGLVVAGDLSQRLGASLDKGEALFTLAPDGAYRIDLRIRESRVLDVAPGQAGVLYLAARPDLPLPFTVQRLTPRLVTEDGQTYFVAEALLAEAPDITLQPGLQGVAKIEVGRDLLVRIWSRDLREWLSLTLWSWWR